MAYCITTTLRKKTLPASASAGQSLQLKAFFETDPGGNLSQSKADLYWTLVQWIGSPCSTVRGVLIGFALYSKKEEPGIELYLAERIANMEVKGPVTSRLKP
jgi:hypothetical protein